MDARVHRELRVLLPEPVERLHLDETRKQERRPLVVYGDAEFKVLEEGGEGAGVQAGVDAADQRRSDDARYGLELRHDGILRGESRPKHIPTQPGRVYNDDVG